MKCTYWRRWPAVAQSIFACSGTITLTAEIVIAADTTIDGGDGQTVTISGNNAVRVFYVGRLGLRSNSTGSPIADGWASDGGGILNDGGADGNDEQHRLLWQQRPRDG